MSADQESFEELERLALNMKALGDPVLRALSAGEWNPTIYGQLNQRESCYELVTNLWEERRIGWAHLTGSSTTLESSDATADDTVLEASRSAYVALELVLQQNADLEECLERSLAQVTARMKQTAQRQKFEQVYHPVAGVAGGFVAEER